MSPGSRGPGERNGHAILSEAQVRALRRRHARGEPQRSLAVLFGVSPAHVNRIVHRRAWAFLGEA